MRALPREVAGAYDMEVGEITVQSDRVHLCLSAPPRLAPARAFMVAPSDLREAQRKGQPFVKGFREWQAQSRDVRIFYRENPSAPNVKKLLARFVNLPLPALAA